MTRPGRSLDELWLETLNKLCAWAAHDLKGALNGVSVNLEVVRTRSAKPVLEGLDISRFAAAATHQLGQVIGMTEAVLAWARRAPDPFPLAPVLPRIIVLLRPGLETSGRNLELVEPLPDLGTTSVSGAAVRLAVASALLATTESSARVVCAAETMDGIATFRIDHGGAPVQSFGADLLTRLREAGVQFENVERRITIAVPRQP